ncbi:MAG TPA: hypothetical protein PLL75_05640 [Candidatus Omnitrophota bacterium]|nr:hypothetical protein [Candidatus Omnitrophota bacterium]HPS37190.1 hypothetical protein [Candidatus Omnitrophota bacterium]
MKALKIFAVLLCLGLALFVFHPQILGRIAQPFLAQVMTDAFDMPVTVDGLQVRLWPVAHVHADKIECLNPPGFKRREHWTGKGIDLDLDLSHLRNKYIRITYAHFDVAIFAIESYMASDGSRTNVMHWYHHMGLDEEDPPPPPVPHPAPGPDNAGEDHWRTRIERLDLDNGSVIFDDRREAEEHRWVFEHLKGYWTGFDFLSDYVSPVFTEYIKLEGTFGTNPPAKFRGEGKVQFADGDNFNVEAEILDGSVLEYDFLMAGLPGEVQGGTFELHSKLLCVESNLDSQHLLTLKDLKFGSPTAVQKIMKYPLGTVLFLLQSEKTVQLDMKVDGYIGDPKFRFISAFTKALQKSLFEKAKATLKGVGKGTMILATEAPNQVKNGLGKLGEILTSPFTSGASGEAESVADTTGDKNVSN